MAQLSDGLVGLSAHARTREHLEWLADKVVDAGGVTGIWVAHPASAAQERELAAGMAAAGAMEYRAIIDKAAAAAELDPSARISAARRLRAELRRVSRRAYFPPGEQAAARRAVHALGRAVEAGR